MFKKFMSLALVLMLVMSVAVVSLSAAQVEITDEAADADVVDQAANGNDASVGAEGEPASSGAEGDAAGTGAGVIKFDANSAGWSGMKAVQFYVYGIADGKELLPWGSSKLDGTDDGSNVWSYDTSAMNIESGKQYAIIFVNKDTKEQTYDLLMDSGCLGDTAKCSGTEIENPVDSSKTTKEARWTSSSLGPRLQITSIGNLVGETVPEGKTKYGMLVTFLASKGKDGMTNAKNNGKEPQSTIDGVAEKLGLSLEDVEKAIKEAAGPNDYSTDSTDWSSEWSKDKSSLKSGGGSSDSGSGSSSGSSSSGSSSSGSSSSGSSSSSTKSGSASDTQTGQSETVLFIMLGVMVAAAGVIFFARKKTRA